MLLWTIREHISDLIAGMRTADGYLYNWGSSNVYVNQDSWPCAKVLYLEEVNADHTEQRGVGRNQYKNTVIFNIRAEFQDLSMTEINPIQETIKLDHDLKRLFGINHSFPTINGGYATYNGHKPVFSKDADIPCGVDWQLRVTYYQRRNDPSVYI